MVVLGPRKIVALNDRSERFEFDFPVEGKDVLICWGKANENRGDADFTVVPAPQAQAVGPGEVQIVDLSVSPKQGSGIFSADLKFSDHFYGDEIHCFSDTEPVQDIFLKGHDGVLGAGFKFAVADVGSHTLECTAKTSGSQMKVAFTVVAGGADLSIVASSDTMTYGGTVPEITPGYYGFVNGDTESSLTTKPNCTTTATSTSPVGTYPSKCEGAAGGNYTINYTAGTVTVKPALLGITASSDAMTQGGTVPTITASYHGFVNGDTATELQAQPICSTEATSKSPARTYSSICEGAAAENYLISYIPGTVTVSPPVLITLTLNGTFKLPYGQDACPDGTPVNPMTVVTGPLVLTVNYATREATATLQGTGQYTLTICGHTQKSEDTLTINGVTISGTVNPDTNALDIKGDVSYDIQKSCRVIDETNGGACIPGHETNKYNVTLNGSIDPANPTGKGQIQWTGSKEWGTWQAP